MTKHDETIGANIRRLREARDISQAALAGRMKELGWKWTQPIVASIEKGERSLKLAEAVALCGISVLDVDDPGSLLGVPITDIWWASTSGLARSADSLRSAARRFWTAQLELARITDELTAAGLEIPETDDGSLWMMQADIAEILEPITNVSWYPSKPGHYERSVLDGPTGKHVGGIGGAAKNATK